MFYEIRRYRARPGRREEWARCMEQAVIPFQQAQGVTVTASFVDEQGPDGYVWIRRFEDEEQRVALYAGAYDHKRWQREILPTVAELLKRSVITGVVPSPASVLG